MSWSAADSAALYGITRWGSPYFAINQNGHVELRLQHAIDLFELASDLKRRGIPLPCLVRLPDVVRARIESIDRAFEDRRRVPAPFVMIPDTSVSTRPAETTNHFLGPGLSLEAPFVGFGPFRFSIYLDARMLFRLDGGRAISSATPQVVTDNLGRSFDATAEIGFEPANWAFNGSGGFRLEFY